MYSADFRSKKMMIALSALTMKLAFAPVLYFVSALSLLESSMTCTIVLSVDRVVLISRFRGYVFVFILMHSRSVLVPYEDTVVLLKTRIDMQFLDHPVPAAEAADFALTLKKFLGLLELF
jgi:hypothetical protein